MMALSLIKTLGSLTLLVVLSIVLACGASAAGPPQGSTSASPSQPGEEITEAPGAVVRVGSFGFGLVPDAEPGTRYAPTEELAEELRTDGLRVVFSGVVEESPRGVRLWGTPLRVTAIRHLED